MQESRINRDLDSVAKTDLARKMVFLTGPRQVGKTTLGRLLLQRSGGGQYFNFDIAEDRHVLERGAWDRRARMLVFDEIHKMRGWKNWLKGVYDGRIESQQLLVTGSARLDTFRQSGDSLAGRFLALRLHPFSVREWCEQTGADPEIALTHLLERGGFPEPCLAESPVDADRWRSQYFDGLVRNDVLEFSRLHEVNAMRLFAQMLRARVGSPLSLSSIARDLHISPVTLKKYLDILEALFIVFVVRPWHRNIARATLQSPKVYFYDTGLVNGDAGVRYENLVACALLKHIEWQQDTLGREVALHYIRTKDGAEVDFALSQGEALTDLIECKLTETRPHRALTSFGERWPNARPTQLVRDLRHPMDSGRVQIRAAAKWMNELLA